MKTKMAVVLLTLVSTASLAMAQVANEISSVAPFPFYVGTKLLPTGSYKVRTSGNLSEIIVSNDDGKRPANAEVITRIISGKEDSNRVVFDVAGNDHCLSEIYMQDAAGFLIKDSAKKHTQSRVKARLPDIFEPPCTLPSASPPAKEL